MLSFGWKIVTLPLIFIVFSWLLSSFGYENTGIAVLTIVVLITIGIPMEKLFLKEKNFWILLLLDFASTVFIIWLIAYLFNQHETTLFGIVVVSLLITIGEYFIHRLLLN